MRRRPWAHTRKARVHDNTAAPMARREGRASKNDRRRQRINKMPVPGARSFLVICEGESGYKKCSDQETLLPAVGAMLPGTELTPRRVDY